MSRSLTPASKRVKALTWITGTQISLALVLLTGAGLLFSTLLHLEGQDFGFDTARIQTFGLNLPNRRYRDLSKAIDFEQRLLEKLRQTPGVTSAASGPDPTAGDSFPEAFSVSERSDTESADRPRAVRITVSSQFFKTLRIPILRGSDFPNRLQQDSEALAIVNEQVAQRYFRGANPIGAHIRFGLPADPKTAHAPWFRIIGVVGDTRSIAYNTTAWKSDPQVYLDFRQQRESPIGTTNWGSRKCSFLVATECAGGTGFERVAADHLEAGSGATGWTAGSAHEKSDGSSGAAENACAGFNWLFRGLLISYGDRLIWSAVPVRRATKAGDRDPACLGSGPPKRSAVDPRTSARDCDGRGTRGNHDCAARRAGCSFDTVWDFHAEPGALCRSRRAFDRRGDNGGLDSGAASGRNRSDDEFTRRLTTLESSALKVVGHFGADASECGVNFAGTVESGLDVRKDVFRADLLDEIGFLE